jgi:DNA-binding beta-propeller fold protein YncE
VEGRVLVPVDLEAIELDSSFESSEEERRPGADIEGRYIIGQLGSEPGQMRLPLGVALDGSRNVYVVDSENARVQKFDGGGRLLGVVGGAGNGPGQFNQPSDIAVDATGIVYVADTWNHRIQKFTADLAPAGAWGQGTRDLINPGPMDLWGPRSIAVDRDGTLLVVDTGTHRVRRYTPDGQFVGQIGRRGKEPGDFEEPTGIAVGPDGSIYVADAGNARIQKFDSAFRFVASWAVEDWADRQPRNKPQIEALPNGRVIATDPGHARLLLFSSAGTVTARLDTVLDVPLFLPAGVTFDAERGYVYITDGLAGHVRRFPLTDFALR